MQKAKQYLFNFTWMLSFCLAILLLFGSRVQVPAPLQVAGRMHPLVLHFPIVLVLLYWCCLLFVAKKQLQHPTLKQTGDWLFLFATSSTVITALLGFLLSKESDYDTEGLQGHLWWGAGAALYMTAWYGLLKNTGRIVNIIAGTLAIITVTIAAHLGGEITHGKGFVMAPLASPAVDTPKMVNPDTVLLYADLVQPILQNKCINCHNPSKRKGELDMTDSLSLMKGGKHGALWAGTGWPGNSLLLQRIHMPDSLEEHMPPTGKPQLTATEKYILWSWIKHGASFSTTTAMLPAEDSLKKIATSLYSQPLTEIYTFKPAPAATIAKLTNNYRVVQPIALQSPALKADFFGTAFFKPSQLTELLAVKDQLVSLSLSKMPVTDEELKSIQQFTQLRRLNLSFTAITGKNLHLLQSLTHLQQLSLSGTSVTSNALASLKGIPSLKKVFVWNTGINNEELTALQQKMAPLIFEKGYHNDTSLLKIPTPALLNETDILKESVKLLLKNYISSAEVRYTLDGSEPDSLLSPVYNDAVEISEQGPVKVKAFKKGWISSDVLETYFYKARYKPDTIWLLKKQEKNYQHIPAKKLLDLVKGDKDNFRDGEWLAFYGDNLEAMLQFDTAALVSSVSLSWLYDPGSYIMPPLQAELWGGNETGKLQLLKKMEGKQPTKMETKRLEALTFTIAPRSLRFIKIVVRPVNKLPAWHPGKGEKGWFFTDEVFVN